MSIFNPEIIVFLAAIGYLVKLLRNYQLWAQKTLKI